MLIREAAATDVPGVRAIYDEEVRTSVSTFYTSPPPTSLWLARLASVEPGDHFLVAEDDGEVAAFAHSSTYRPRAAYQRTREVSVYVGAPARGRGAGRRLYDELHARLRADGVHLAVAVVARPNPASEALHRALGYDLVGVLPEVGRKFDTWVDTGLWALRLE